MSQHPKMPSEFQLWYDETLKGKMAAVFVILAAAALTGLYNLGQLDELVAGTLFASLIILGAAGAMTKVLLEPARAGLESLAVLISAVLLIAISAAPVWLTVFPGETLGDAELVTGDTMALPAAHSGHVRALVTGELDGDGSAKTDLHFRVGSERIHVKLTRTQEASRSGPGTITRENDAVWIHSRVPEGATKLELRSLRGSTYGPVRVRFYQAKVTPETFALLALGLILFVGFLAARVRADGSPATAAAASLAFAAVVYTTATPATAVHAETGALLVAVIFGAVVGGPLTWLWRKILRRPRFPKVPSAQDAPASAVEDADRSENAAGEPVAAADPHVDAAE